ncbi:MAG: M23 family metallopeptidase [Candidatus Aminicenantales bacterium]
MGKKFLSLIIVPHSKAGSKTISFSKKTLKTWMWIFIVLGIVIPAVMVDYVYMKSSRKSYKALYHENLDQKETIVEYENSVDQLKKKLEGFENYAKKLNMMAGLTSPEVLKELGIGGESVVEGGGQSVQNVIPPIDIQSINQKAETIENNLNTLVIFFEDQAAKLACTPTIWPTIGWLSSSFGMRPDPFTGKMAFHKGIDIATNYGNPIVATADGIVIQVKFDKIGGRTVIISHREELTTVYCHLSKFLVKEGQTVKRGDVIGFVGKTGRALGPHLHYEVRINGNSVNPYNFVLEED